MRGTPTSGRSASSPSYCRIRLSDQDESVVLRVSAKPGATSERLRSARWISASLS